MARRVPVHGYRSVRDCVLHLTVAGLSVNQIAEKIGRSPGAVASARCHVGCGRRKGELSMLSASDRLAICKSATQRLSVAEQAALAASALRGLERQAAEARQLLGELRLLQAAAGLPASDAASGPRDGLEAANGADPGIES